MRRIWAAVFCVTGLLGVRARLACGKVEDRTIIAKSMSHGDLCSVISSLTLNGNFPVAFEGGVASSSIRGGFAEKITSYWIPDAGDGLAMFRERGILTTSNRESVRKAGASVGSVRGECKRSVRGVGFRRGGETSTLRYGVLHANGLPRSRSILRMAAERLAQRFIRGGFAEKVTSYRIPDATG